MDLGKETETLELKKQQVNYKMQWTIFVLFKIKSDMEHYILVLNQMVMFAAKQLVKVL